MEKLKKVFTPNFRRWLYRVLIAAAPLLVAAGWVSESEVPLIVALVGAILGLSLADANVPDVEYTKLVEIKVDEAKSLTFDREKIENPFKNVESESDEEYWDGIING